MKSSLSLISISVLLLLGLSACDSKPSSQSAESSATSASQAANSADSTAVDVVKTNVSTMQKDLAVLVQAIDKKEAVQVQETAKKMHKHWLSFENTVRDLYPLLYTDVEKFETPIFYGSGREPMDFASLSQHAKGLEVALQAVMVAKESQEAVSEVMQKSVEKYRLYVIEQVEGLVEHTKLFTDAVKAKEVEKAKRYYASARVFYERIEPVAESFGDLDPKIDARLADVEEGSEWTGFHPLERALWEQKSLAGDKPTKLANQLMADVLSLQKQVKSMKFEAKPMVAGAMELLNEAANTKITGEEEAYSHLDLLDFYANVEGAKAVYLAILPALNVTQKPLVEQLDKQFEVMEAALNQHRQGQDFVPYTTLKPTEIRVLANELTKLAELVKETGKVFN